MGAANVAASAATPARTLSSARYLSHCILPVVIYFPARDICAIIEPLL